MIPLERLRGITKIIAHGREDGPCADGLAAALIVRDVLPEVEVVFVRHETSEYRTIPVEPGLLFLDISPPKERAREFLEAGTLNLDHHATAAGVTRSFAESEQGAYASERGVSAATLAYREVWTPLVEAVPAVTTLALTNRSARVKRIADFAELAGVYDTWRKESPLWDQACAQTAVLYFYSAETMLADRHVFETWRARMQVAPRLLERNRERAEDLIAAAYRFVTPKGSRVATLAGTDISLAAELVDGADVVVGFGFRVREGRPSMKLAFRSCGGGFAVRAIAEALGGGGHEGAASAWIELHTAYGHPYKTIRILMEMY